MSTAITIEDFRKFNNKFTEDFIQEIRYTNDPQRFILVKNILSRIQRSTEDTLEEFGKLEDVYPAFVANMEALLLNLVTDMSPELFDYMTELHATLNSTNLDADDSLRELLNATM